MRNRFTARLVPAALATLATAVFAAGCGSSNSTGPTGSSLAGTWNLTKVNGSSLPAVVQAFPPDTVSITQGTVILTSTTWNFHATIQLSLAGLHSDTTQADSGTYTVSGSTLSMKSAGDTNVTTATVNGTTVTVSNVSLGAGSPTLSLVFQKQ